MARQFYRKRSAEIWAVGSILVTEVGRMRCKLQQAIGSSNISLPIGFPCSAKRTKGLNIDEFAAQIHCGYVMPIVPTTLLNSGHERTSCDQVLEPLLSIDAERNPQRQLQMLQSFRRELPDLVRQKISLEASQLIAVDR